MRIWQNQAECAGDMEFGQDIPAAIRTCQGCPVRAECHAWAKGEKSFHGVAGGAVFDNTALRGKPTAPERWLDWTVGMRAEAHAMFNRGERSAWAVEGERAYQSARKRLQRAGLRGAA